VSSISSYHAHVYFDAGTRARAEHLCKQAGGKFAVTVGRMHDEAVGPHPRGSCQLAFEPEVFDGIVPWLILNRTGLTVFVHANTGEALKDHTDHVMWLGPSETLKLSIFDK
jgi:DOPA 4,5-dioxygenase